MTRPATAQRRQGVRSVAFQPTRRRYMSLKSWLAANSYQRYREAMICECGHSKLAHGYSCNGIADGGGFCACLRGAW